MYSFPIVILVLSIHLRLINYDSRFNELSYNKEILRSRYRTTAKTISYPKISRIALYRLEFYLLLVLIGRSISGNSITRSSEDVFMGVFNIVFIAILLDVVIYLFLSKYTKLLQPKSIEKSRI